MARTASSTSSASSPRPPTAPVRRAARLTSFSATAFSRSSASLPSVWRPTEITIMSQPLSRSPPGLASSARRRMPSPASASIRRPTARCPARACQSSASRSSSAREMSSTRSRSSKPRTRTPWWRSWYSGRWMAAPPLKVETMSSRTRPSGSSMTVVVSSALSRRSRICDHVVAPCGVRQPGPEPVRRVLRDPVQAARLRRSGRGRGRFRSRTGQRALQPLEHAPEHSVRPSRHFWAIRQGCAPLRRA